MPYNFMGDLYKGEIVKKLQEMGCNVKSVHALNLILEEMGILEHSGNGWLTSYTGIEYSIYNCRVFNAEAWHPSIVGAVFDYLKKQGRV